MKILNKSIKRLALLSTAVILPMLAITSCNDDDDPPAAAGNDAEVSNDDILNYLVFALDARSSVNITIKEELRLGGIGLLPGTEIITSMKFAGNSLNINTLFIPLDPSQFNPVHQYTVIPQITFPEDNSGVILRIPLSNISEDQPENATSIEYILHYNFTFDIDGFHRFDLDIEKSSFSVDGGQSLKFGEANQVVVPVSFIMHQG